MQSAVDYAFKSVAASRKQRVSGMRWTLEGARSMLNVRAAFQSDHWRSFLNWYPCLLTGGTPVTPSSSQAFDFVDRVLLDPEVHKRFTKDPLGNGINTIYSNCSDVGVKDYTNFESEPGRLNITISFDGATDYFTTRHRGC